MKAFLIVFIFFIAGAVCGQTHIRLEMLYRSGDVKVGLADHAVSSITPSLRIDRYLNFRYALTTGISYLTIGYNTKGRPQEVFQYTGVDQRDQIANRWRHDMLRVPLGITWFPKSFPVGFTVGSDFNFALQSKLWDLKDTLQTKTYYVTDVTRAFPRVKLGTFAMISYSKRMFTVTYRYSFVNGNLYSTKVVGLTDKSARENKAYWRSWYHMNGGLIHYFEKIALIISYRIK